MYSAHARSQTPPLNKSFEPLSILFASVRRLPYVKNMNNAARSSITQTALYLEIYSAREARRNAEGTPAFASANRRVAAAFAALQAFRSTAVSVAA